MTSPITFILPIILLTVCCSPTDVDHSELSQSEEILDTIHPNNNLSIDTTVFLTLPDFTKTIFIDGSRIYKSSSLYDKNGQQVFKSDQFDSCATYILNYYGISSGSPPDRILLLSFKKDGEEWIRREYSFEGKVIDEYKVHQYPGAFSENDTILTQNIETGMMSQEIIRYYTTTSK